jgi:hypothetical protein
VTWDATWGEMVRPRFAAGSQVDDQLERGGLLDWNFPWAGAAQDLIHHVAIERRALSSITTWLSLSVWTPAGCI